MESRNVTFEFDTFDDDIRYDEFTIKGIQGKFRLCPESISKESTENFPHTILSIIEAYDWFDYYGKYPRRVFLEQGFEPKPKPRQRFDCVIVVQSRHYRPNDWMRYYPYGLSIENLNPAFKLFFFPFL